MHNREAQFVLHAYRPGGQDAGDPQFSEALAQARRDPSLERWLTDSIAFDKAIADKLRAIEAPVGLRESILAGGKVSHPSRWRPLVGWSIAAALMVAAIAGSLVLLRTGAKPPEAWHTAALTQISELVEGKAKFNATSPDANELVAWLRTNHAPVANKLPASLEKLASLGCETFYWHGQPFSVICFQRGDGGLIHLVATKPSGAFKAAGTIEPQLVQEGRWATATWRADDTVYMLALEGASEQLRPYLL
jgi:hypothetical protein